VALEKRGVPTCFITTDEFAFQARREARMLGMGTLPIATIPHPLADNDIETVMHKATAVAGEVAHILTASAERLSEEYRERHAEPPHSQVADCGGKCGLPEPEAGRKS
jgi:hypothetical protein